MLAGDGYEIVEGFVDARTSAATLASIRRHCAREQPTLVSRSLRGRSLRYRVIDGRAVDRHLPALRELQAACRRRAEAALGAALDELADPTAAVNVNLTPPGGEYRWHYDRNEVTGVLYLNHVEGGEIEVCPNYRIMLGRRRAPRLQRLLDRMLTAAPLRRLAGRRVAIRPAPGMLVLMRGNRCLHSVAPVGGDTERIAVVMAFDLPGAAPAAGSALNRYLYSRERVRGGDPNYRRQPS